MSINSRLKPIQIISQKENAPSKKLQSISVEGKRLLTMTNLQHLKMVTEKLVR